MLISCLGHGCSIVVSSYLAASPHITLTFLPSFLFSITYLWPGVRIGEKAIGREGAFGCLFIIILCFCLSIWFMTWLLLLSAYLWLLRISALHLHSALLFSFFFFFFPKFDWYLFCITGPEFQAYIVSFFFLDLRLSGVASVLGFPEQILLLSSCPSPPLFHFIFQLDCVAFFFFNSPRYQSYEHDLFFFFKLLELYLQITRVSLFFYCWFFLHR